MRYGGSLRAFSQGLADELQAGGKTAAGARTHAAYIYKVLTHGARMHAAAQGKGKGMNNVGGAVDK